MTDSRSSSISSQSLLIELVRARNWTEVESHVKEFPSHAAAPLDEYPLHVALRYQPPLSVVKVLLPTASIVTHQKANEEGDDEDDDDDEPCSVGYPLHIACRFGASDDVIAFLADAMFQCRRKHFLHMWLIEGGKYSPLCQLAKLCDDGDRFDVWPATHILLQAFLAIEKNETKHFTSIPSREQTMDWWMEIFETMILLGPRACPPILQRMAMRHFLKSPAFCQQQQTTFSRSNAQAMEEINSLLRTFSAGGATRKESAALQHHRDR